MGEIHERFISNGSSKCVPEPDLTVDELLVPLKVLHIQGKWITFMPNKPDKYGLKFWTLVEVASKYVVAQCPYLGKDPSGLIAKNVGTKVVSELSEITILGAGYNITGDNFSPF